jgi:CheY-like chemotaxis protein
MRPEQLKILVVDDEKSTRLILKNLLTKKFPCKVMEAENGLDGLKIIQEESPDLVILDVIMPVLDGLETLEAIRSDPSFSNLPVIVMSIAIEKMVVLKIISLGISDFLLKPLDIDEVTRRIGRVIQNIKSCREEHKKSKVDKKIPSQKKILLVDKDLNFRTYFSGLISGRFEIIEAETGVEGLQEFIKHQPSIVCLGEGLSLLNERLLARKIRTLPTQNKILPKIYLLLENAEPKESEMILYNGILKKSFVPEVFLREFTKIVLGEESLYNTVLDILKNQLTNELITAIKQTFGVMTLQEVRILNGHETGSINKEVCAMVDLIEDEQKLTVTVGIIGSRQGVLNAAEKMIGAPISFDEGAAHAFEDLINTIGGRIRSSLEKHGIKVDESIPKIIYNSEVENCEHEWKVIIPFQTTSGQRYFVGIAVNSE